MKIFQHTFSEPDLWRGWIKNGQSVEISRSRHGWDFGGGIHIHGNDDDMGNRMLFLKFWRWTVILPMGIVEHPWEPFDGPQWSVYASQEFGLTFHWGLRRKSFDWPWNRHTLAYEEQLADGSWRDVMAKFKHLGSKGGTADHVAPTVEIYSEVAPYTYTLRSGEVQHRTATVSKNRRVLTWRIFKALGWPRWIEESIEVEFDDEVGERSGSWKGGAIVCGYDMLPGEAMIDTLRRMEGERKFR